MPEDEPSLYNIFDVTRVTSQQNPGTTAENALVCSCIRSLRARNHSGEGGGATGSAHALCSREIIGGGGADTEGGRHKGEVSKGGRQHDRLQY